MGSSLNRAIRTAKRNYYSLQLDPKLNPKKLWKNIRNIGISSKAQDKCTEDPNILMNNFFSASQHFSVADSEIIHRNCSSFNFQTVTTI